MDRAIARWTARFKIQVRPEKPKKPTSPVKKQLVSTPKASRYPAVARAASSWVIDDLGMRGVIWMQSYLGRASPKFYRGAARDNWEYDVRDEAVLLDPAGEPVIISSMGDDWIEIGAAWQALEDASVRKNAKIQLCAIAPFDADMSQEEMTAALRHFCKTILEPLGLPYSAVIHAPSEGGDQRNFHPHISFGLRPMRRIEPYCWEVADWVRGELDGKDGVQMLRHLWAHSMSEAAEQAERRMRYTGLGYGARGLDLEAGEHLGEGKSAMVARGSTVWAWERNRIKNARNAARRTVRDANKKIAALTKVRDAVIKQVETERRLAPTRTITSATRPPAARSRLAVTPASAMAQPRLKSLALNPVDGTRVLSTKPLQQPRIVSAPTDRGAPSPPRLRSAEAPSSADLPKKLMPSVRPETRPAKAFINADLKAAPSSLQMTSAPLEAAPAPIFSAARLAPQASWVAVSLPDAGPAKLQAARKTEPAEKRRPASSMPATPVVRMLEQIEEWLRNRRRRRAKDALRLGQMQEEGLPVAGDAPQSTITETPEASAPRIPAGEVEQGNTPPATPPPPKPRAGMPPAIPAARWRRNRFADKPEQDTGPLPLSLPSRQWLEAHPCEPWSEQRAAAENADQARLTLLIRFDAYVAARRDGTFGIDPDVLSAIGVTAQWLRRPDIQQGLMRMHTGQQKVIATLAAEAGRRPLAFARAGKRFWPRDLATKDLARLDRWAADPGFQHDVAAIERNVRESHDTRKAENRTRFPQRRDGVKIPAETPSRSVPDGFGGMRDTPAPVFEPHVVGVRLHAFDQKSGRPTDPLLRLLRHCGEHPHSVVLASDGRLAGVGKPSATIDALISMLRHDDRVHALVVATVSASRKAGKPIYPVEYAPAIRALSPSNVRPVPPHGRDIER